LLTHWNPAGKTLPPTQSGVKFLSFITAPTADIKRIPELGGHRPNPSLKRLLHRRPSFPNRTPFTCLTFNTALVNACIFASGILGDKIWANRPCILSIAGNADSLRLKNLPLSLRTMGVGEPEA